MDNIYRLEGTVIIQDLLQFIIAKVKLLLFIIARSDYTLRISSLLR